MPDESVAIRSGTAEDLDAVDAIQSAAPEAAYWPPSAYLAQPHFLVALRGDRVAGFAVARALAEGESELLNLAVHPELRRRGIGRHLIQELRSRLPGDLYLEVRESNQAARNFYQALDFKEVGKRPQYYQTPSLPAESAIVMKFHSCYK